MTPRTTWPPIPDRLTREQRDAYITSVLSQYHRVEEDHPEPCPECEDIVGMVLMIEQSARAEQAAEAERLRAALVTAERRMSRWQHGEYCAVWAERDTDPEDWDPYDADACDPHCDCGMAELVGGLRAALGGLGHDQS